MKNMKSKTKDLSLEAARLIAELEEERWCVVLGNPAKARFVIDAV